MRFRNHKLVDGRYEQARDMRGTITPDLVILHDTASALTPYSAMRYLKGNGAQTSVHFVIELDGTITQMVPTNRGANHAGRSTYHGRSGCNDFTIGIEIVNPGRMTWSGGKARTWYGQLLEVADWGIEEAWTPEHGDGVWMPPTAAQITAVLDLLEALFDYLPSLKDIRSHWYVSPGRKVDTNPLFPLEQVRARILGREEAIDREADERAEVPSFEEYLQINVPGSALNMRRWPSFNPNVIASIPHGTVVPVLKEGTFDNRLWFKVVYDGLEGWVVARYVAYAETIE